MSKYQIPAKDWRVIATVLSCILVLVLVTWSSRARSAQTIDVQARSQTAAFQVIGVDNEGSSLTVRLKNVSNKTINGYTFLLPDGGNMVVDYTTSGRYIVPGAIDEQIVPMGEPSASTSISSRQQPVTLIAVTFTDYTSDGDPEAAAYIMGRRLGVKKQLEDILPIMKSAMAASDSKVSTDLTRLKSQIADLPESEEGMTQAVIDGLHDAKQDVLRSLERVEQKQQQAASPQALREELNKKLADHEKRVARL